MTKNLHNRFLELMEKKKSQVSKKKIKKIRDIGDKAKHNFICEAFTYMQQSNNPEKYFIFERLIRESIAGTTHEKKLKKGSREYRISYYIVSRKLKTKTPNKWVFGQSCAMIPIIDFNNLLIKAKKEKVLL